jgi:SPP1 gp7 family putative phage head morphogenesis protein
VDAPSKAPHPPKLSRAERAFNRQLLQIANHVGQMIGSFEAGNIELLPTITQLLRAYADALRPWATQTVTKMLGDVNARDLDSWRSLGTLISQQLRHDITHTPVGEAMRALLHEQVGLITSIPIEAGERLHELTLRGLENSSRAAEFIKDIQRSGQVTKSRATLIARTEIARTASVLTQVRAESAGLEYYVWETSKDGAVRPGHREMQGQVCRWDDPPSVDEGNGRFIRHHPGRIWNCRCYPRPVLPEEL